MMTTECARERCLKNIYEPLSIIYWLSSLSNEYIKYLRKIIIITTYHNVVVVVVAFFIGVRGEKYYGTHEDDDIWNSLEKGFKVSKI